MSPTVKDMLRQEISKILYQSQKDPERARVIVEHFSQQVGQLVGQQVSNQQMGGTGSSGQIDQMTLHRMQALTSGAL